MLNRFIKGIVVVFAAVAIIGTAHAQDQAAGKAGRRGQRENMRGMGRMMKDLNLTAEQQAKIKTIQDAQKAKVQPIRENASLTPEQKKEQMRPIVKDTMKQILEILTPEQKAKLQELRKESQEKRGNKGNKADKKGDKPAAKP